MSTNHQHERTAESGRDHALVVRWVESARLLAARLKAADDAIGLCMDSPLREAAWRAFGAYTDLLAETIGDTDKWLEWFAWECDFGSSPKEMTFADGETLLVVGASDLLAAIQTGADGCRKWPFPHRKS